jgi:CRP-like cAMP-binding protein
MNSPATVRVRTPFSIVLLNRLPDGGVHEIPAGSIIYGPQDEAGEFFLMVDGLVVISRVAASGSEIALDVRAPGETFGDSAVAGLPRRGECARALTCAKARRWAAADIASLMEEDPQVTLAATRMLVERAGVWRERITALGGEALPRRIARTLLYLRGKTGRVLPPLSHAALASLAGAPETAASRCLDDFTRRGLVASTAAGFIVRPELAEWLRGS